MAKDGLLIVEDDPVAAHTLWRIVRDLRPVRVAHSVAEARAELDANKSWLGFILDVNIGDARETGFDLLEQARKVYKHTPALMITGQIERDAVRRAYAVRAELICKPFETVDVLRFVQRASLAAVDASGRLQAEIERVVGACQLTPAQAETLIDAVIGTPRGQMIRDRGVSENTFKEHVRSLLRRTGARNLDQLALTILRAALLER